VVRSAPEGSGFAAGDRVSAFCLLVGSAEVAVAPVAMTFTLPADLNSAQAPGQPALPRAGGRLVVVGLGGGSIPR
jgi:NADPH:quinone reductase